MPNPRKADRLRRKHTRRTFRAMQDFIEELDAYNQVAPNPKPYSHLMGVYDRLKEEMEADQNE